MFEWVNRKEIYLYQKPIDFRKQLDGLTMVVATEMERQPNDGSIYLFRNRTKDKIKVLLWERNGFFMGYKRLEEGRFDFPKIYEGKIQLNLEQLYLLFSGLPMTKLRIETSKKARYFC